MRSECHKSLLVQNIACGASGVRRDRGERIFRLRERNLSEPMSTCVIPLIHRRFRVSNSIQIQNSRRPKVTMSRALPPRHALKQDEPRHDGRDFERLRQRPRPVRARQGDTLLTQLNTQAKIGIPLASGNASPESPRWPLDVGLIPFRRNIGGNIGQRYCEMVQPEKRVWIYSNRGRRQGRVRSHLSCRTRGSKHFE
jgi:hypothetical protein